MSVEVGRAAPGGTHRHVRRVRLPADRRTPAAARAVVRAVLEEARLTELLDQAVLLTTELSTNGVLHAKTDVDIEVAADARGLTVTVMDFVAGPVEELTVRPDEPVIGGIMEVSERGRGLLLVDHFASRWGTTHHPSGKGVWFRLDRPGQVPETSPDAAEGPTPGAGAIGALLAVTPDPYAEDPVTDFAGQLLARVADQVGASGGIIRLDRGDGRGVVPLTRYGRLPRAGVDTLRVPLAVNRPYAGELELDASPSAYARPLAELVAERVSLTLENDRLRRADRRRQTWLTFLAEASELLAQSLDVELTMALIPQLVVPRLGQWCAVHVADEWGQLRLASAAHSDETALPRLYDSLRDTGADGIIAQLRDAARTGSQIPLGAPTEGIAVPLVARGLRLGTLAVGRHAGHRHEPDEVAVLEDVSRRAAVAIENARIHSERRRVAQTLQRSLLPPELPKLDGIGLAAQYVPTGDGVEVGGDFYDAVPLPDGRLLLVVGDVAGKGVEAAAATGLVRDVIRVLVRDGRPLGDVLATLNETMVERGAGRYCTLALAAITPDPGRAVDVSLHLAGHEPPLLLRDRGGSSFVGSGGTALGLLPTISSPEAGIRLMPGDALIFFTDGVTERRRGREFFGLARLRDAVEPLTGHSADVIAARLRAVTLRFSPQVPRDDIAILVIRNDATGWAQRVEPPERPVRAEWRVAATGRHGNDPGPAGGPGPGAA